MALAMTLRNGYQCCAICEKRFNPYIMIDGLPYCEKHAKAIRRGKDATALRILEEAEEE